jgi:hypothetical protein
MEPKFFITAIKRARHFSLPWARSFQSTNAHPISWIFILILSYHLHLGLPGGLFSLRFPSPIPCMHLSCPPIRAICPHPRHSAQFDYSDNIWWRVQAVTYMCWEHKACDVYSNHRSLKGNICCVFRLPAHRFTESVDAADDHPWGWSHPKGLAWHNLLINLIYFDSQLVQLVRKAGNHVSLAVWIEKIDYRVFQRQNVLCWLQTTCHWFFLGELQNCDKRLVVSSCPSVRLSCLSAWFCSPTGRIFAKFDIWIFSKDCQEIKSSF